MSTRAQTVLGLVLSLLIFSAVIAYINFAPEVKVDVKIYKYTPADETDPSYGNLIYCETGDLDNSAAHTYQGKGKIAESKAVAC